VESRSLTFENTRGITAFHIRNKLLETQREQKKRKKRDTQKGKPSQS
jgi:hypothetical protein